MPHLFRGDLENIEKIIKEDLKPREYKLETRDFEYKDIEEINKDSDITNEFYIQTHSPYIHINFYKYSAEIYSGDDDIKMVGVIKKVTEIIEKRERRCLWFIFRAADVFAPIIIIVSLSLVFVIIQKKKFEDIWYLILIFISSIMWYIFDFYFSFWGFSKIEFVYKKNRPSFLNKNRDQIILLVIGAVLGALVMIFFQTIFR